VEGKQIIHSILCKRSTIIKQSLPTTILFLLTAAAVCAQTATNKTTPTQNQSESPTQALGAARSVANSAPPSVAAPAVSETDAVQKRMKRARALAAAHQLAAAASELETIRASAKDEMVRNVTSLMLMGIYLEDGNYARAESMLEETFKNRSSQKEASVRTYFALSGQAVIGARAHIARYRTFGINVAGADLPAEATNDLDRLRGLLERMTVQTKELLQKNPKDNDAFALLEDVAGIRVTLARDNDDRAKWENEYNAARARLATLPTEIASIGGIPAMPSPTVESRNTDSAIETASSVQPTAADGPSISPDSTAAAMSTTSLTSPTGKATTGPSIFEVGPLAEKATKKVVPTYPQIAKNTGASGLVRVKIVVDETGSVAGINWIEGPLLLRQAAQEAVRQWKFQPTVIDGKPVRVAGYVDFGFSR
jgi:TonB family protein